MLCALLTRAPQITEHLAGHVVRHTFFLGVVACRWPGRGLGRDTRIYLELGFAHQATLTMQSNDLIRVSVPVHTTWTVGQHFFVQFLSFGPHAWTTHPFTSCSLPPRQGVHETREAEVVFYIRQREGVTGRLGRHLSSRPHSTTKVTLDGNPFGALTRTVDS